MKKWNYDKQGYEPYVIPEKWHCPVISFDMDEAVNCPQCGHVFSYGDGYTSREIHTDNGGMGLNVCPKCHEKEIIREQQYRDREAK